MLAAAGLFCNPRKWTVCGAVCRAAVAILYCRYAWRTCLSRFIPLHHRTEVATAATATATVTAALPLIRRSNVCTSRYYGVCSCMSRPLSLLSCSHS